MATLYSKATKNAMRILTDALDSLEWNDPSRTVVYSAWAHLYGSQRTEDVDAGFHVDYILSHRDEILARRGEL